MPLRCEDDEGHSIEAQSLSETEWKALQERNRRERHLKMPCCTAKAVPKRSMLGNPFFAHKAKGTCNWKPETETHRTLKRIAIDAARAAGWNAQSEVSGTTPSGERWTADVLARKGEKTIAVEIQWSGQSNEETLRRQQRYEASKILGVWLLRQPGFPITRELPAACIGGTPEEGLQILIPKYSYLRAADRKDPDAWNQVLTPEEFGKALFEGRFRFGIEHIESTEAKIVTGTMQCWKCKQWTRIVTFLTGRIGPYRFRRGLECADRDPEVCEAIRMALSNRRDIGTIKHRFSRSTVEQYVSNACCHCGVLIGRFYERAAYESDEKIVTSIRWKVNDEVRSDLVGCYTQYWAVWRTKERSTVEQQEEHDGTRRPDDAHGRAPFPCG